MKKNMVAMLLAASLAVTAAAPSVLAAAESTPVMETVSNTTEDHRVLKTDTRIGIQREKNLIRTSGMSLDEWDAAVKQMRQEGLKNPLTEESILAADPQARVERQKDVPFFISGKKAFEPVTSDLEAYRLAYRLVGLCGGSDQTDLRLWSKLRNNGVTVYSFQQMTGSEAAHGNTMKIALDEDGTVSAVFSSISEDADEEIRLISRAEAEEAVRAHLKAHGFSPEIFPDETDRAMHSPIDMAQALEIGADEDAPADQLVWIVYSRNNVSGEDAQEQIDYPFIAHYVSLDGTYLYSLPVRTPGDEESISGYRKQDVFEGMRPGTYTGQITNHLGEDITVTVPVMQSDEDGKWYLGDWNRRIAVADFAEAAYGENHDLKLVSSDNNDDWDQEDLYMFANYIQAWDLYADMGWVGPDGEGTDVIILKNMCTKEGTPFENACSIGKVENYQMFGYTAYGLDGTPLRLVQGLDVMAHEYTHTFTGTVMNENLYENDLGAINEAMSDIMGNLTEYIYGMTDDTQWKIGENTGMTIRSMSDPAAGGQPAYVWDCNYGPHTDDPNDVNDRGGVHVNSSLLSRIAALLCLDHGMTYEEGISFWTMAAMGMTPRTDYQQIPELLRWALEKTGNEKYRDALEKLIEEEQLTRTELPDQIPLTQKIVKLQVPDTDPFRDQDWALVAIQLNTERLFEIGSTGVELLMQLWDDPKDYVSLVQILKKLCPNLKLDEAIMQLLSEEDDTTLTDILTEALTESVSGIITQSMSWEEAGTGEMTMVLKDEPTLYMLLSASEGGTKMDNLAVLLFGHWYDLTSVGGTIFGTAGAEEAQTEDGSSDEILSPVLMDILNRVLFSEDDTEDELPAEEVQEEETGSEWSEEQIEDTLDGILNAFRLVDYFLTDEAERPSLDTVLTRTARAEYLPVEGLDEIQGAQTV